MKKQLAFFFALSVALNLGGTKSNAQEQKEYSSHGVVEFVPTTEPTDPVDPETPDPENPVQPIDPTDPTGPRPGTTGPLSIDYVSSFDFGKNRISNEDQTYYARAQKYQNNHPATPNYVQVSDNRGTNQGWLLTVKQLEQFRADKATKNDRLTGAQLTLSSPTVTSNSQIKKRPVAESQLSLIPEMTAVVTTAKAGSGSGLWVTYWGTVEERTEQQEDGNVQSATINKAVALFVPGSTPKDAVNYRTKLHWALMDVPGN